MKAFLLLNGVRFIAFFSADWSSGYCGRGFEDVEAVELNRARIALDSTPLYRALRYIEAASDRFIVGEHVVGDDRKETS